MTARSSQEDKAEHVRALKVRLRLLWQAVKAAKGKSDDDDLRSQFLANARRSGLVAALGRHGEEDTLHVINWGLKGLDPWPAKEFE